MKIIEAMKKIGDLTRKAEDLRKKVNQHHVDMDCENPTYGTPEQQRQQIADWIQAHSDIVKNVLALKTAIQRTNLQTQVTIELGGIQVTKTITEWIHRRRELAKLDLAMWESLNDRNLQNKGWIQKTSGEKQEVNLRRYYDPKTRDEKRELYASEPAAIDARLEVVNAVTDLIE